MSTKTETLDLGGEPSSAGGGAGLVTLYAPDPAAVPSAFVLPEHALVLGREPPPGGLALPFVSVSRVHARLARRGAAIELEDLESRNGSFVNGSRVERAVLEHGDELRVGEVVFSW